ncbi:hypothetical protein DXG03_008052 [Asterophora parasitica]|uniref:Uncharacterized protein n=1 Tax=Asterophora parasitica TaxID=117018 RepID=A0A9P7G4X7_9AGAR|nr:hypothetical protein DXG03_008052 [Asterophora parasitica]
MNDTTTSTFPKSWACCLHMLQACFKVWTKDLATGGPETLANNAMDLYHMWVVWNNRLDELCRLDDAIWEEEVDAVRRVSKWLDQTGQQCYPCTFEQVANTHARGHSQCDGGGVKRGETRQCWQPGCRMTMWRWQGQGQAQEMGE